MEKRPLKPMNRSSLKWTPWSFSKWPRRVSMQFAWWSRAPEGIFFSCHLGVICVSLDMKRPLAVRNGRLRGWNDGVHWCACHLRAPACCFVARTGAGKYKCLGGQTKRKNIIKPNMSKARRNKSRGFLSGLYLTEVASFPHSETRLSGFFFKFYKSGLKQAAT